MKKDPKMNKKIVLFGFFWVSILSGFFLPLSLVGKNEPVEEKPKDEFVAVDESAKVKEVEEVKTEPEEEEVSLEEYLSGLFCNQCGRHCSLLSPRCGRGVEQASAAEAEFYQIYGDQAV